MTPLKKKKNRRGNTFLKILRSGFVSTTVWSASSCQHLSGGHSAGQGAGEDLRNVEDEEEVQRRGNCPGKRG